MPSQIPAAQMSYLVDIAAFDSCGDDCACSLDETCDGAAQGNELVPAVTTFAYPAESMVEVVFAQ